MAQEERLRRLREIADQYEKGLLSEWDLRIALKEIAA